LALLLLASALLVLTLLEPLALLVPALALVALP
jgi:hypothetical protein